MQGTQFEKLLGRLGSERRIHYALDRIEAALQSLGNPHRNVHTLVIGGTNGKGTTSLYLSAALTLAGHRTVSYLSPHLQHPRERFLLDMRPIAEEELTELAAELIATGERFALSYFEFLTLCVFVWAARRGARFLVLEVGLGGRLDAVNVTDPVASVITNVSYDHMDWLGDTLEKILDEKLGILRPESLLFTGVTEPGLVSRLEARCAELDAIYYYASAIRRETLGAGWDGQNVLLNGAPFFLRNPGPGAVENAATAFLTLQIAFPSIPMAVLQRAFAAVQNPARLETVSESPRVVLSGDHNPAGISDLTTSLARLAPGKLRIVCGFSPDKPYAAMYRRLAALTDDILLVPVAGARGPMPADYPSLGDFRESPARALDEVMGRAERGDTVLVTGSLYLAGEARSRWRSEATFWRDPRPSP